MQITIDIPDHIYKTVIETGKFFPYRFDTVKAIKNGKALQKGKWFNRHYIKADKTFDMCVCSNCREEFSYDAETGVSMYQYDYCPNCRTDMREVEV